MSPAALPPLVASPGPLAIREMPAHASNYNAVSRVPTLIVIHATHGSEGLKSAENTAAEISKPLPPGKRKSWHYAVDADSIVRSVPDRFRAWHCGASGNAVGIGVELCGRADQTLAQWYDAASLATLRLGARLVAELCLQWGIPPVRVHSVELVSGRAGITTHADVSAAWRESSHTDPGAGFPLSSFVAAVARATVVLGPTV